MNVKEFYLWLVWLMSHLTGARRRNNLVYLMSFDDNIGLIRALAAALPAGRQLVVFYRPAQAVSAQRLAAAGIATRPFQDGIKFVLTGIPIIMSARVLFCDNYYAFLGGLYHPRNMTIVQLWHAAGAIKRFGWEDPTTKDRSASDRRRFQAVYDHFDEFVVGAPAMGAVFQRSYHVPPTRMQLLGYPRSDRLRDSQWVERTRQRVYQSVPGLTGHRVILYAPTYREGATFTAPDGLAQALTADPTARVVVKLHPVLQEAADVLQAQLGAQGVVASELSTTDLLTVADTVITDYSSVAFDYALLPNAHSLLFYLFDLPSYTHNPGVQADLLDWLPGPVLRTRQELAAAIVADRKTDLTQFNHQWNQANDGRATDRVVDRYVALVTTQAATND